MWILANRLASFNPQIDIREDSPMVLKSVSLVYAKDCVRLHQDGPDCVCSFEKDTIRLPNFSLLEASMLVQSVFNFMDDWHASVTEAANNQDFQLVADLCNQVFENPTLLINANCRVLGMSRRDDEVDEEWRYLSTFGYSSPKAMAFIHQMQPPVHVSTKASRFSLQRPSVYKDGLTIPIYGDGTPLANLTVLEKDRPLNRGDMQLMELLADILRPHLTSFLWRGGEYAPALHNLLNGVELHESELAQLKLRLGWEMSHIFQVYLLSPQDREKKFADSDVRMLLGALEYTFPDDLCGLADGYLVLLADNTVIDSSVRLLRLKMLARTNNLRISFSLPAQGMHSIPQIWKQAQLAYQMGAVKEPDGMLHDFYYYAVDYMVLNANSPESLVAACHPDVMTLWLNFQDRTLYQTLMVYLENERSITKTHAALNIHKNTLLYRLNKITESLQYSLEDSYTRKYMQLSFFILERLDTYRHIHRAKSKDADGQQANK